MVGRGTKGDPSEYDDEAKMTRPRRHASNDDGVDFDKEKIGLGRGNLKSRRRRSHLGHV